MALIVASTRVNASRVSRAMSPFACLIIGIVATSLGIGCGIAFRCQPGPIDEDQPLADITPL